MSMHCVPKLCTQHCLQCHGGTLFFTFGMYLVQYIIKFPQLNLCKNSNLQKVIQSFTCKYPYEQVPTK